MAARFSDIVKYFEKLASEHIAIGHSEDEKHFYRYEIEEALSGSKEMNYPALILERYGYSLKDNKSDNVMKDRSLSFMLLGRLSDVGDFDAMHDLWDHLEEVCDDIIARIKGDKRKVAAVRDFDLNNVEVDIISNQHDKNYGVVCTLIISSGKPMDVDADKWNYTN